MLIKGTQSYYILCYPNKLVVVIGVKTMIDIFKDNGSGVFRNKSALHIGYVPKRLIARDEQIKSVADLIKPVFTDGYLNNGLLFGKPGVGKTVVARYVLKQLEWKAKVEDINVKHIMISCGQVNTPRRVLIEMLETLEPGSKCKRGMETAEYYSQLWNMINRKKASIVVVLDEIDQLKNIDILYAFSRVRENYNIDPDLSLGVIGISNDIHFKNKLDPRVFSSFTPATILFAPYNADQILKILQDRVGISFKNNALEHSILHLCSALSAQEHGDARLALKLLLTSGEVADSMRSNMVLEEHVRMAHDDMNVNCLLEMIKTLPYQAKITLYSIIEATRDTGTATTGEVTQVYKQVCNSLDFAQTGRSMVSVRITELDTLGFINTSLSNLGRGKTRQISLTEDPFKIMGVLVEDQRFEFVANQERAAL